MTAQRYQRLVVWLAVLYLYFFMLLAAASFTTGASRTVLLTFTEQTHFVLTPDFFALFSFSAVFLVPFQLLGRFRDLVPWKRRLWYILGAGPLFLYTVPVAVSARVGGSSSVGVIVYLAICLSFVVISLAVFRPNEALSG